MNSGLTQDVRISSIYDPPGYAVMKSYPIDEVLPQLMIAVSENPSVILKAPPGAGKTTRVPLALLKNLLPGKGRIIMLEPRRLAAVSASAWMAGSIGEEVGSTVGYAIRFDRRISAETRIEVVTEGILTRRLQSDPGLEDVAMVIFDEFHERNLNSDLALALCLEIQKALRADLKILIMSATLDCGPISEMLGGAPVITSEGKSYPVDVIYQPPEKNRPLAGPVADVVIRILKKPGGDILVFLPGYAEIRATEGLLAEKLAGQEIEIHPLYGDLPIERQEKAILPSKNRKIVLATNIAETSLTIEGVSVVVDSGMTKCLRYNPSTGMNRLVTTTVSKASAEQRRGRAGRTGPGVCYRLYSQYSFQAMINYSPPEILTADLSSLVLELSAWGVKDPSELSWLDNPPQASVSSARQFLVESGAITKTGLATETGRKMAELPLHPRLSRLIIRSAELAMPELGADLAAILSERDILKRGLRRQEEDPDLTERLEMLQRWKRFGQAPDYADSGVLARVTRTAKQLAALVKERGNKYLPETVQNGLISRLLLGAFPDRIAKKREEGQGRYLLSIGRGVRIALSPGLAGCSFLVAPDVDEGKNAEGVIRLAAPVTEEDIRLECGHLIEQKRNINWDRKDRRIKASAEENLGAVLLSEKSFNPSDEEVFPFLCDAIRFDRRLLVFSRRALNLTGRVALMKRVFPEEAWPDLGADVLAENPEVWLQPWLRNIRSAGDLERLDLAPAVAALLNWEQQRLLDIRAPLGVAVPSGSTLQLDYTAGDFPVLAVKLQEMFGLADTPTVAEGRVKVLLHLLSPSRRPLQITQDLRGFWSEGYQHVRKEMRGRYPKHPWPEDPWNAVPTRKTKRKGER